MNTIAFDLGGSGGKVFLGRLEDNSIRLETLHRFEHSALAVNGNLYWDILRIFDELLSGVRKAIAVTGDEIAALGIDSFCNDYCLVSPRGRLLTQMHCYRDERTVRLSGPLYDIMSKEELYRRTGNQNAPFNTLMQLGAAVLDGDGMLLAGNTLLFLPDLLAFFLSQTALTEYTLASVSQMYDCRKRDWDREILRGYQIPESLFAPVVGPGKIHRRTSAEMNRQLQTRGFPIATVCGHDTACAFLGSALQEEHIIISCGTWAVVGTQTRSPVINEFGFRCNIANEGSLPGCHRLVKNVMGTWLLQQIREDFSSRGDEFSYAEMERQAREAEPFRWFIDVDNLLFYAPGNMCRKVRQDCRARYGSCPETCGELVRCVYESLAMKYRYCIGQLKKLSGIRFGSINMIGGGAQSALMCRFTADACNLPVVSGPVEATAFGNIITQLLALGRIKTIEEGRFIIRNSCETTVYQPESSQIWDKEYQVFLSTFHLSEE